MTTRAVMFSDVGCKSSIEFMSCWQGSADVAEAGCQTPKELFRFSETETQSGIATQVVQDQVSGKNDGLTLLEHFCKLHPKQPREVWREGIARGKVTVDCDVITNVDAPVSTDFFIEYVNVSSDKETQTLPMSNSSSSSASTCRGARRGEGKGGSSQDDDGYYSNASEDEEKDGRGGGGATAALDASLRRLRSVMETELSNSSESSAFQGYLHLSPRSMGGGNAGDDDAEVQYWRCLSVDLERRRVVYPDWGKAKHALGRVLRCTLSRSGERLYDVEFDDGTRLPGVREEHIRLLGEPEPSSVASAKGRQSGAGAGLREGVRVHARTVNDKDKGRGAKGQSSSSAASSSAVKFLPGRIVRVHKSGRYDVEVEGGRALGDVGPDDVIVGLGEGAIVECRRPSRVQLQATGVTWNATGSSLAVSLGRADISGWCDVPGALCVWNLFSRDFKADDPEVVLDHPSCLLCCAFHPLQPALIAAGSFSGEVVVWDLSSGDLSAPKSSPIAEHVHKEPVVDLSWVRAVGGSAVAGAAGVDDWLLCSAGADGKVLFWSLANGLKHPMLGAMLSKGKASRRQYPSAHGASSLSLSSAPSGRTAPWLLVGQEGGAVVRGQLSRLLSSPRISSDAFSAAQTTSEGANNIYSPLRRADEVFAHQPHTGPVNALACSPFSRNLFLSAGGDGTARLCHLLEPQPLLEWEVAAVGVVGAGAGAGAGSSVVKASTGGTRHSAAADDDASAFFPLTDIAFSPSRALVFGVCSGSGELHLFDLAVNQTGPVATLVPPAEGSMDGAHDAGAGAGAGAGTGTGADAGEQLGGSGGGGGGRSTSAHNKTSSRRNRGTAKRPALTSLAFNKKQRGLLAAADGLGRVHVWKLGWGLTSAGGPQAAAEASVLQRLESQSQPSQLGD